MVERIFRYSPFNLEALLALSRNIRGRSASCDGSKPPMTGSLNWAVFVCFDDGVEWVFRSPRLGRHAMLSEESALKMLQSEAATLKYLRSHSTIPVPEVYSYSGSRENDIGLPYILMSKAPGCALSEYDWFHELYKSPKNEFHVASLRSISDEAREKVMKQLGTVASQLLGMRLEKIGSLVEDSDDGYQVGECLSPSLIWQWRDSLEDINRGPFDDDSQYLDSLVSAFISHARELPLTPHAFFAPIPNIYEYATSTSFKAAMGRWNDFMILGQKIDHSKNRLSYCIAGQLLRELIPRVSVQTEGDFPLTHPDLHFGNIFVDEDFNLTCIIDWGSASSAPIPELLATPGPANSATPPSDLLVTAFRVGLGQGTQKVEQEWWEKADLMWPFQRLVRMLSTRDYDLFQMLYASACRLEGEESINIPRLFHQYAAREHNKKLLVELSEDDSPEDEVKHEERSAFGCAESDRVAVARKLTLMSEMNQGFIADKRLWQWVEDAVKSEKSA